ncbi:MAG: hypothetical protein CMJ62_14525 [Planctomycetaceae bacterium]|nr:hypothetical protein [Planctomycetaceae bacterium]
MIVRALADGTPQEEATHSCQGERVEGTEHGCPFWLKVHYANSENDENYTLFQRNLFSLPPKKRIGFVKEELERAFAGYRDVR